MTLSKPSTLWLTGHLLVAMPTTSDPRFDHGVVFLCAHTKDGAMGIMINRPLEKMSFKDLATELNVRVQENSSLERIYFGGPVETGRGFLLHSLDKADSATLTVSNAFGLTTSVQMLEKIMQGEGPKKSLFALGYAGWGAGQLETEIQENGWLIIPADESLLFDIPDEDKWLMAMKKLGITPATLSGQAGRA